MTEGPLPSFLLQKLLGGGTGWRQAGRQGGREGEGRLHYADIQSQALKAAGAPRSPPADIYGTVNPVAFCTNFTAPLGIL